jgi:hypothetical protein
MALLPHRLRQQPQTKVESRRPTHPALMLGRDRRTLAERDHELAALLADKRLAPVPRAGHLMQENAPDAVAAALRLLAGWHVSALIGIHATRFLVPALARVDAPKPGAPLDGMH